MDALSHLSEDFLHFSEDVSPLIQQASLLLNELVGTEKLKEVQLNF